MAILSACGDDVTNYYYTSNVSIENKSDLNACESSNAGSIAFVSGENTAYICSESTWKPLAKDTLFIVQKDTIYLEGDTVVINNEGVNGQDGSSCFVEPIDNGYKILCGEDSVGVVLNGKDGTDGKDGANGKDGTDGIDGSDGKDGKDGMSAYEIAVKNGFEGPESEWLASLTPSSSSVARSSSSKALWSYMNQAISYGEIVDERDGQVYKTVIIGTQIWMAENLNYYYNSGTARSACYSGSASNCELYGRLYQWSAVVDSAGIFSTTGMGCGHGKQCNITQSVRGVCPKGWHVPDTTEIRALDSYVNSKNGSESVGKSLKSNSLWSSNAGTDMFGFSALPSGVGRGYGDYVNIKNLAYFWSSSDYSTGAYAMYMDNSGSYHAVFSVSKSALYPVRCLKD